MWTQSSNAAERVLPPGLVDEVLACPLLSVEGQRVRFRHDLVRQFFAAADLVHSAVDGQALGALLDVPANRALAETALGIAGDPHRVWDALQVLAAPGLVFSALTNGYGADVAELAIRETRDVLERAIAATAAEARPCRPPATSSGDGPPSGSGPSGNERSGRRRLGSHPRPLRRRGPRADRRTDEICRSEAHRLHGDGERTPVSQVVGATYAPLASRSDGHDLAASYVMRAFLGNLPEARGSGERRAGGLASRFVDGAAARSWGRFFLAVAAVNPGETSDQALFASCSAERGMPVDTTYNSMPLRLSTSSARPRSRTVPRSSTFYRHSSRSTRSCWPATSKRWHGSAKSRAPRPKKTSKTRSAR